jgi:thiol-disulfide isomerase/thioredoxin
MMTPLQQFLSNLKLIDNLKRSKYSNTFASAAIASLPPTFSSNPSQNGNQIFSICSSKCGTPFVGIYFGAQWCPPCRSFSPQLSQFTKDNADFSVVFVSADKTEANAVEFVKGKPFYIVPYRDEMQSREKLMKHFNVKAFPTLIVLDTRHSDTKVVTRWGRMAIQMESSKGALVKRWLNEQGGLVPTHYWYIGCFILLCVVTLTCTRW